MQLSQQGTVIGMNDVALHEIGMHVRMYSTVLLGCLNLSQLLITEFRVAYHGIGHR